MKTDRLIGILSVLLQEEKTTAPELAERFEVSRRTVNRDIESLCKAGIPVQTAQGKGGGIRIMKGYRLDRTILTRKDMQMILAGLRSLDSAGGSSYYAQLMEKLQAGSSGIISGKESILIDLSTWHRDSLAPKIKIIQDAIEFKKAIRFMYYAPNGETNREIEPYYLIFKWTDWYVYGYCLLRNDFRMFRLTRMDEITESVPFADERSVPMPDFSDEKDFSPIGQVKILFDPGMKWQLVEEFGINSFTETQDGRLLFEHEYADEEDLLSWMLTCRDKATVLEPQKIRAKLLKITSDISKKYKGDKHEEMV